MKYTVFIFCLFTCIGYAQNNNVNIENVNVLIADDTLMNNFVYNILSKMGIYNNPDETKHLPKPEDNNKFRIINLNSIINDDYIEMFDFLLNYKCDDGIKNEFFNKINEYPNPNTSKKQFVNEFRFFWNDEPMKIDILLSYVSFKYKCDGKYLFNKGHYNKKTKTRNLQLFYKCKINTTVQAKCYKLVECDYDNTYENNTYDVIIDYAIIDSNGRTHQERFCLNNN